MFWKKELLKGLVEVKAELARQQSVIALYDLMMTRQQATIERLLDRIQAGSFKEYKLAEAATEAKLTQRDIDDFYNPLADENLAGMALEVEGSAERETDGS
jgi:hypothetical protein